MKHKSTPQNGVQKSLPTATAADTGNGGAVVATNANLATVEHSAPSTAAKGDKQNTGKGSRVKLPVSELLQIWQQATHDLKAAGVPVSVGNKDGRCILILAGVRFDASIGDFELIGDAKAADLRPVGDSGEVRE